MPILLTSKQRELFSLISGITSLRYFGEALRNLATALIAGLATGLTLAQISTGWSPASGGSVWFIFTFGFALFALGWGSVLIVQAAIQEKAAGGRDIVEAQDAPALVRTARIFAWGSGLLLFLAIVSFLCG